MKLTASKALMAFVLFSQCLAFSAEIPVFFQKTVPPVPVFTPPDKSALALANQAFLAKYGAEMGVLGTSGGAKEELIILVSDMAYASTVWSKMVAAGDAYNSATGGIFRYGEPSIPSIVDSYRFLGRVRVAESSTAVFSLPWGTPSISRMLLAMDSQCVFGRASVQTVGNVPIQTTQLIASHKLAPNGIGYEHLINGGSGAALSSIMVTLGPKATPGFGTLICPIDIWVQN